jgi:hypothetical protein
MCGKFSNEQNVELKRPDGCFNVKGNVDLEDGGGVTSRCRSGRNQGLGMPNRRLASSRAIEKRHYNSWRIPFHRKTSSVGTDFSKRDRIYIQFHSINTDTERMRALFQTLGSGLLGFGSSHWVPVQHIAGIGNDIKIIYGTSQVWTP